MSYFGLVVMLRVSGNRTLSKMNSFDLVVTVAFGSTLSTILVSKDASLAPTMLGLDGRLREDAMKRARVTHDEVLAAVRQQGHGSLENIDAVILEADGSLSVISASQAGNRSAYGELPSSAS